MRIAIVHARPGHSASSDEHARRVVAHLVARGDDVTVLANERAEGFASGAKVETLKPFALSGVGRAKAFYAAAQAWSAKHETDADYAIGRSSRAEVVWLAEGVRTTRIELAAVWEGAKSAEE